MSRIFSWRPETLAAQLQHDNAAGTLDHERPQTRADCAKGMRPCPFVGCRYHLALEVTEVGSLRFYHGSRPLEDFEETTCALDVAEDRACSLVEVAELLGVSHERVHQIEKKALQKIRDLLADPTFHARPPCAHPK